MHSFQMFFARPLTSLFLLQKEQTINRKKENLSIISGMLPPKNVKFNSMKYTVFTNGGHAGKNWCLVMKARRWRVNKNCK